MEKLRVEEFKDWHSVLHAISRLRNERRK